MDESKVWYALFRNEGEESSTGREIKHMVVAWLDKANLDNEIDRYIAWDRKASGATKWDIVQYARSDREEGYYKEKKKETDPDLLEYHWVWEDFQNCTKDETVEIINTII
jgi:hypothetical protein